MAETYAVVVRHNLVAAIERLDAPSSDPVPATPLEVSTQLARNHQANGCIDGRYLFDDPQRARIFASLCLEFTKALLERRLAAVERLRADRMEWRADDERPDGDGEARGTS